MIAENTASRPSGPLGMSRYQWTVLLAAWLGWGFDSFDALLFSFVAPNCIPALLHLKMGTVEAANATKYWNGLMGSILLLSWATGGVLFGRVADRIGRSRTLLLTMVLYAVGTAACAFAPNMAVMVAFRILSGIGIGGEWAAGASLVAEVVPEKRRVEAGALLYTAAPVGLFLATYVNKVVSSHGAPETSWRGVFLCGLLPAAFAFIIRAFIREPERWKGAAQAAPARLAELFGPENARRTLSGFLPALVVLAMWWSCNTFIAVLASGYAKAGVPGYDRQSLIALANNYFNWGGVIGTLLTIPAAKYLGRRPMYGLYFALSAAALFYTFGVDHDPVTRLKLYFLIGLTVFGSFGTFTYYLPELFPTRLRATGAGFCYNIGRVIASVGPFLVGKISQGGMPAMLHALFLVGFVPVIGLLALPFLIETKGRTLAD